jgi:hypothetical protein
LNIGFRIADEEEFDIFIFHDVDLLPSKELKEHYITKPKDNPVHIAAVWDRYGSNPSYFGGIVAFNRKMFKKINGFPNNFWGWGGEDDELLKRTKKFYSITKPTRGYIVDLENLNLEQKLDYLRENDLKFMKKREALEKHAETWKINGLNEIEQIGNINMIIHGESKCGDNCERLLIDLPESENAEPLIAKEGTALAVTKEFQQDLFKQDIEEQIAEN